MATGLPLGTTIYLDMFKRRQSGLMYPGCLRIALASLAGNTGTMGWSREWKHDTEGSG